ncbi:MAG: Asp-tRNA(Asn)/Glu-tRNA(Gln) amidotransferase subunit GatB [Treponema sp.]|jgi:aspartyl-tRNA(Asn)/glutamyl-tRNA(Gln) amidotransferase subunit B|nr:Asp-tRNA(Asn)/Glu-tRNA(Gln) amidotransferase subunit GatB [Treponema sp.]
MYQSFIGLEVHIHLLTKTKVFCGCRSAFGDEPNSNICPGCMAYPGTLPALNIEALRMAGMVARALNCRIPEKTWFERKQYFYPDISKNFQLTQSASPIGQQGYIDIEGQAAGKEIKKRVRIKECHLEEDAGKMLHTGTVSLVDYNRAGVSLLEIVTEPDIETGEEAELFVQQLRRTVRYLGVCNGNMEEGSLRADANVSINLSGKGPGRIVEIKNLNSSRFVKLAINYEIARHSALLDEGKVIAQETRLWNENRDETLPMRQKENAHDYRYFPEPDLPVFCPDAAFLKSVDDAMVELPVPRRKRVASEYQLNEEQAEIICDEKAQADYFEATVTETESAAAAMGLSLSKAEAAGRIANWLLQDVKHILGKEGIELRDIGSFRLNPKRFASLAAMTAAGKITGKNARQTLEAVIAEDKDPAQIVKERGWELISDPAKIAKAIRTVAEAEAATVAELRGTAIDEKRRRTLMAYLTGKVLAATGGRADPKIVGSQIDSLFT